MNRTIPDTNPGDAESPLVNSFILSVALFTATSLNLIEAESAVFFPIFSIVVIGRVCTKRFCRPQSPIRYPVGKNNGDEVFVKALPTQ